MAERGLGRGVGAGLGALFGAEIVQIGDQSGLNVPISRVEPKEGQPRTYFDEVALADLADSISRHGMIQPITVRQLDSGYYQIIAGERRWRAARLAGIEEVPVRVVDADDAKAMELALVENLQREDLNPIEEALGYRTLMDKHAMTQEQMSQSVGKSRPAIANSLRLLSLSDDVLTMVETGTLSAGHARALLAVRDSALQLSAAKKVVEQNLSVRQTETLAARIVKNLHIEPEQTEPMAVNYLEEVEKRLISALGRKVRISPKKKSGRIELEYYGRDDFEALILSLENLSKRGASRE